MPNHCKFAERNETGCSIGITTHGKQQMVDAGMTVVVHERLGMCGGEQWHQRDDGASDELVAMLLVLDDGIAHVLEAVLNEGARAAQEFTECQERAMNSFDLVAFEALQREYA